MHLSKCILRRNARSLLFSVAHDDVARIVAPSHFRKEKNDKVNRVSTLKSFQRDIAKLREKLPVMPRNGYYAQIIVCRTCVREAE